MAQRISEYKNRGSLTLYQRRSHSGTRGIQLERRKVPKKVGRITESNRININRKELYNRMKRESVGKIVIVQINQG